MTLTCPHCQKQFTKSLAAHSRYCKAREGRLQAFIDAFDESTHEDEDSEADNVSVWSASSQLNAVDVPPVAHSPDIEVLEVCFIT